MAVAIMVLTGGTDGKGGGQGSEEEDAEVVEEPTAHASEKGTAVVEAEAMEIGYAVRGEGDEKWSHSGSVALSERVLGELEVKTTEVCRRVNVRPATVRTRVELTGPVLLLPFYKQVSRILSSVSF